MPKVRTIFDTPKRYHCPIGSEFDNVYQEEIDSDTGRKTLVIIGKTNIYDRIQADLEGSKIENIMAKLAAGDLSVLRNEQLIYADATEMPKTLMEAQNIVVKAKQEFENFPTEIKRLFNNSAEQYVSEMGTEKFLEKMAPYNEKMAAIEKEGNLAAYNKKVKDQADFEKAVELAKGDKTE